MNLIFILSLEQRALINIAITLWSHNDVRDVMSKTSLHTLRYRYNEIYNVVREKSIKLQLPKALKEKLLDFIIRVGSQIILWVEVHHCNYRFVTELPAMFVWTSRGTVNNTETAKLLVMSGTLDDDASYALACMYCLEDEIKYCWEEMFDLSLHTSKFNNLYFISYWSNCIGEMERFSSNSNLYPSLILESARSGNEAALRYFFQKVNMKEDNFVMEIARVVALKLWKANHYFLLERYSGIMIFLLFQMTVGQQEEVFVNHTYAVLNCFLVWPWQNLFLDMVKDKWHFLSKKEFNYLLHSMVVNVIYKYNYQKLFTEFWQQSPKTYKKYATTAGDIASLILHLYRRDDDDNVKLIFKDISIGNCRERIIYQVHFQEVFVYLISSKKWSSVEFLIQVCLSSRTLMIDFRDAFRDCSEYESINEYQLNKFLQIIDGCILKRNKKRRMEDNNTSSKRIIYS